MQELAYRIRAAEPEDADRLKEAIGTTMAHPERGSKRKSYRGAVQRGEVLVLEQYDLRAREWRVAGFVEHHVRTDNTLTIKDAGSIGDTPHAGIIKHLVAELLRSVSPPRATAKVRSDATAWNALLDSIPGFYLAGKEYRRPHYYFIWEWSPELALRETRRPRRGRQRR